jgi:hypothetical protein
LIVREDCSCSPCALGSCFTGGNGSSFNLLASASEEQKELIKRAFANDDVVEVRLSLGATLRQSLHKLTTALLLLWSHKTGIQGEQACGTGG